jgi:hypothetical protein
MTFRASILSAAVAAAIVAFALVAPARAGQDHAYLKPDLRIGEQLTHVFSKAVSINGHGFSEYVRRVSGTGDVTVTSIGPEAIVFSASYRYDGRPVGNGEEKRLADGVTGCWDGHCSVNLSTSGTLFNRALWGEAPADIHAGTTWTANIAQPWELGPPGTETVRVVRVEPSAGEIVLVREGSGSGRSTDDGEPGERITITTGDGKPLEVSVVPGRTTWRGRTIVRKGVIVSDTIMVERHVRLVSASGRTFEGEQRSYTLENLLQDRRGS